MAGKELIKRAPNKEERQRGQACVLAFGFFARMAKSIYIRKRKKGQVHYLVVEAGD